MVTKYDVFEIVYKSKKRLKPYHVLRKLNKKRSEYANIYRILNYLVNEEFLVKQKGRFFPKKTEKNKQLYDIIYYCIRNEINYNLFLDKKFVNFIKRGLTRGKVNLKKAKINPRTFTKYIKILDKNGLLLIVSKKPFSARIFYNTFINNLLVYFGIKNLARGGKEINYLSEIEKEFALFKRLRKKNERMFEKVVKEFEVYFVHHSLSLEGNAATLPDTIKILEKKVVPHDLKIKDIYEIKNYNGAISEMFKDIKMEEKLSFDLILKYHKIAMNHIPSIAGKVRKIGVHIKGNLNFKVAKVSEINAKLGILIEKYNSFSQRKKVSMREIISFASYFHNEFQYVHPFVDGNSRITRLITFHLLHSLDVPILDIPFGLLDEYLSCTKGSKRRDDKLLFFSLQKIILYNLKKVNERLS